MKETLRFIGAILIILSGFAVIITGISYLTHVSVNRSILGTLFESNQKRIESDKYQFITAEKAINLFDNTLAKAQVGTPSNSNFISIKLDYYDCIQLKSKNILIGYNTISHNGVQLVFRTKKDFIKYYKYIKEASRVYFDNPHLIKQYGEN